MLAGQYGAPRYRQLLDYVDSHPDPDNDPLFFNQTLIGGFRFGFLFLDAKKIQSNGEMEVIVHLIDGDQPVRDHDFGEFLKSWDC